MKIDWLLISRSLDGKLTPEQQRELQQWLDESVKHRQLLADIQTYVGSNDSCKEQYRADFERRMDEIDARKALLTRRKRRIAAMAAAAIILPAAILLLSPYLKTDTTKENIAVLPENARVMLVVDDQVITLDSSTDTISANVVNSNGQITYNKSDRAEVKINKLIIPKCMEYSVKLSDGTVVWLNAGSELTYPDKFTGDERHVSLKGEAYFDVAKDSAKPFIVDAEGVAVNVYGTQFNVNTHDQDIEVVLVEGSIALKHDDSPEVRVRPNQLALYNKATSVMIVKSVDVMNYTAWRYGEYRFEDERLSKILDDLSLWYDIEVEYAKPALRGLVFTCYLPKTQDITELLKYIEKTSYVKFELKNKLLIVK